MAIKTIPLTSLETTLRATLDECANTGETVVIEMPDQRNLVIKPFEGNEDESLVDDLLQSNVAFQEKVAKSAKGPRQPFIP